MSRLGFSLTSSRIQAILISNRTSTEDQKALRSGFSMAEATTRSTGRSGQECPLYTPDGIVVSSARR